MARYLYSEIASTVQARLNCVESHNGEWFDKHEERIERLVSNHLPHGSGFDSGTKIEFDSSHADKLVFSTSFHHMDESGMYDTWTDHQVIVTPSLVGDFHLRITGRNYRDIKEYIAECFECSLHEDIESEITFDRLHEQFPEIGIESRWIDSCFQRWDVIEHKREHKYSPVIGDTIKLRTFGDYTARGIHVWAWLKVFAIVGDVVSFQVLNGDRPTPQQSYAPIGDVQIPLNWKPLYDADEILSADHSTFDAARESAIEIMEGRRTQ